MDQQFDNTTQSSTEVETAVPESATASKEKEAVKVCHNCQTALKEGQKFCSNCGATVEEKLPKLLTCTNCGIELPSETKFCPECGTSITLQLNTIIKQKIVHKKKWFLIGGIVIATIFILCFALREIPVEDIVLSETKIELTKDKIKNISCTVYPEKATDKTVTWISSDDSVATVNPYGTITAVGKGTCTITAKSGDQIETIHVTVKGRIDFKSIYTQYCVEKWANVGRDNSYLSIDVNPDDEEDYYIDAAYAAIININRALGLPYSLYEEMRQTTWSMGKQNETYTDVGITVSWTYHPDKGLEVTYKNINN